MDPMRNVWVKKANVYGNYEIIPPNWGLITYWMGFPIIFYWKLSFVEVEMLLDMMCSAFIDKLILFIISITWVWS